MRISDWSSDVCASDLVGQRVEQPPDRPVQQVRAAAGEIAARGAAVGHEQRVAGEQRVADQVRDAVAGVPGHRDHARADAADREFLAVVEQVVELRTVRRKVVAEVEDRADGFLHRARSEEHTYELQSLMRMSYAVFSLIKTNS